MSCCGQKRQQWQQEMSQPQPASVPPVPVMEQPVLLQYLGNRSYLVKGPKTGNIYLFAAKGNSLAVDGRDATLLLADSRRFSPGQAQEKE